MTSGAERQRRYMERLRNQSVPERKDLTALKRKLRAAETRIERLEVQADGLRAQLKGSSERRAHWYRQVKALEQRVLQLYEEKYPGLMDEVRAARSSTPRSPDGEPWRKLSKLIAMLGSDKDGEVQNAADAMRRILAHHGLSFSDVANRLR